MNAYFGGNGFTIYDRGRGSVLSDKIKTTRNNINDNEVTFENAWGICDEDIYSKIQTIKNTNTLSNVSIINDNIILVDKDGNTLLPNNFYTVKDNQLVLNNDLSSTFVIQNNQVRVKPQLVSQQKEKYTMYDSTTKGFDSSCEVDFVNVPSFEIKNLKMSGLPSNFKQDKLTV